MTGAPLRGRTHPPDCAHCAAIRGDANPAKRSEVRARISAATSTPAERSRRSAAVAGEHNPRFSQKGSYKAAHARVVAAHGRAAEHVCGCGNPAFEWALNKNSPRIIPGVGIANSRGDLNRPYSMSIDDYDPLCVSCHRRRDGQKETA